MPPFRYLLHFSYIGTRYSGVAEQRNQPFVKTVYAEIIKSLQSLKAKPAILSALYISSRTDAGVHALHNTAHIDLDFNVEQENYTFPFDKIAHQVFCDELKHDLNKILLEKEEDIRILKVQKVKPTFTARNRTKARTYLYRLALLRDGQQLWEGHEKEKESKKSKKKRSPLTDFPHNHFLLPFEMEYATPVRMPFDYEAFKKAAELFTGQHNFSAFTTNLGRADIVKNHRLPVKTLKIDLKLNEDSNFLQQYFLPNQKRYSIIEIEITGESFLYKMIRKLVGGMIGVAKNSLSLKTIEEMFACPPDFYNDELTRIDIIGPKGLILKKVHYDERDFDYTEDEYEFYLKELIFKKNNNKDETN